MRRFEEKKLLIATHNRGKFAEVEALFQPFGIDLVGGFELGLEEPEETETTFVGNARLKAEAAVRATGLPALSDDSGIAVDALDGAPGVYTADWAETGNGRDFKLAMRKTWDLLEERKAPAPRSARFLCTLCLAWPDGHHEIFEGRLDGEVVWPMRGEEGHGYDPIFMPEGYSQTLGEMEPAEKNRISHRADAFGKMIAGCFA
jgi:XTP/dITP diphosphohydrolase